MARTIAAAHAPLWHAVAATQVDCWKITRRDGGIVRITNHDQPVWIGSEQYLPSVPETPGDPLSGQGGGEGYAHSSRAGLTESVSAVDGLISSDQITERDLLSGLYEGAVIDHRVVDARMPDAGSMHRVYRIEQVAIDSRGRWRAELSSYVSSVLSEKRGDVVTQDCRNQLFDGQCGRAKSIGGSDGLVRDQWQIGLASGNYCTIRAKTSDRVFDVALPTSVVTALNAFGGGAPTGTQIITASNHYLAGLTPSALTPTRIPIGIRGNVGHVPGINGVIPNTVAEDPDPDTTINALSTTTTSPGSTLGRIGFEPEADWFKRGLVVWRTGNNAGASHIVETSGAFVVSEVGGTNGYVTIELEDTPPLPVQVGDTLTLETGCDGTRATCRFRFDNLVNFRGEPTVADVYETLKTPSIR